MNRRILVSSLLVLSFLSVAPTGASAAQPHPITRVPGGEAGLTFVVDVDDAGDRVVVSESGPAFVRDRSSGQSIPLVAGAGAITANGTTVFSVDSSGVVRREVVGSGRSSVVRRVVPDGEWVVGTVDPSATGRYLAVEAGNGAFARQGVFLVDRRERTVTAPPGPVEQQTSPSIDDDGSRMVYVGTATAGAFSQVYLFDASTGTRKLVTRNRAGRPSVGFASSPMISGNGRYVVFVSTATDLVEGLSGNMPRLFRHDLRTRTTVLVSESVSVSGAFDRPWIDDAGRRILYTQPAQIQIGTERFTDTDVFMWTNGSRRRIVTDTAGGLPDGGARTIALSGDARLAAFSSNATDITSAGMSGVFTAVLPAP